MNYWSFKGSVSNEIKESSPLTIGDSVLTYLIITNKSAGTAIINLQIRGADGVAVNISPLNQQLAVGECYTDRNLILLDRETIIVQSDSDVDFYFSVTNDNDKQRK